MQAAVNKDVVERRITIGVLDVPDIDISAHWHRVPRIMRPDNVVIVLMDDEITSVTVTGGILLKNGQVSDATRGRRAWYTDDLRADNRVTAAPQWVRMLCRESPQGVTEWRD